MSRENFPEFFPEKNILKRLYITIFFFIFALDIKYIITNNYASFYNWFAVSNGDEFKPSGLKQSD